MVVVSVVVVPVVGDPVVVVTVVLGVNLTSDLEVVTVVSCVGCVPLMEVSFSRVGIVRVRGVSSVRVCLSGIKGVWCDGEEYGSLRRVMCKDTVFPGDFKDFDNNTTSIDNVCTCSASCRPDSLIDINDNASAAGGFGIGKMCHHAKLNSS